MKFNTELLEYSDIQLIDGDRGKNYPKESDFMVDGYCLFLSAKNVTSKGFEFSEKSFIDYEKDKLLRAGKLKRGDIVVTTRGTIGNIAFYGNDIPFDNIRINSGMMIFRADEEKWNRRFLYFLLRSNYIRQQIVSLTSGSAVPQLPARDLKKFILPRLPKDIQGSIEKIIGDFTDKIQLNRQINQTLESMAQAIFQSWFVDFDPVKAKIAAREQWQTLTDDERTEWLNELLDKQAYLKTCLSELSANNEQSTSEILYLNIAAMTAISSRDETSLADMPADEIAQLYKTASLFPERLVESELGEIPEGWEFSEIGNEVAVLGGGTPSTKKEEFWGGDINWTSPKDMSSLTDKILLETDRKITEAGLAKISSGLLPVNAVLMSSRAPVGYLAISKIPVAINQGYIAMKCEDRLSPEYIVQWIESVMDDIKQRASGTTFAEISKKNFKLIPVIVPEKELIYEFSQIVSNLYEKITEALKETKALTETRDALLPRLLSGEIELVR